MRTACVILAAGLGKRMNSSLPKVLHPVCGITMLQSVLNTAKKLKPEKTIVVAGRHMDMIKKSLAPGHAQFALQKEAKGTGHALLCAQPALRGFQGVILIMNGDSPLVSPDTIKKFLRLHERSGSVLSVLSFQAKKPDHYGRVIRNAEGIVLSIVEDRDAGPGQKKIHEVNSGVYALSHDALHLLKAIKMNRAKGEYYLTDIVAEASDKGLKTQACCVGTEEEFMGVNTREELYRASELMRREIIKRWMRRGVNFLDTGSVFIHATVYIGKEVTLYPNICLEGRTTVGTGSVIYPNVRIKDSSIGSGVEIKDFTVIEDATVKDRASVGPFARIRPGSEIGTEAKIGNFVELKKTVIGRASKASHLSYLGDARIGRDVNIGAGTITCNYDGRKKHLTVIGDGVFVGSDTQLVAPVKVGKGAYIGAGSTITKDVPPMALAVSRTGQQNIKDWAKKRQSPGVSRVKK